MMNFIPVAVGQRHPELFAPAVACARSYGKIDVFHGDNTNCKTMDAEGACRSTKGIDQEEAGLILR
jgi:hypothetical protein